MLARTLFAVLSCSLLGGCGDSEQAAPERLARPVTVLELATLEPSKQALIPGVVVPYRQTDIAFEVGGRVLQILDVGDEVRPSKGEHPPGEVGDSVIAVLDSESYERAARQAGLRLESARLELRAQQLNLETIVEARLARVRASAEAAALAVSSAKDDVRSAEASVALAQTTVDRNRELLPSGAVSDIAVKRSETELEAAQTTLQQVRTFVHTREREREAAESSVAEVEGDKLYLQAQIDAQAASINELEEQLEDARRDVERCVLLAPFAGRITSVHAGEGSYVQVGTPIVTVTMMNPIKVEVTASAAEDDRHVLGMDAIVYPTTGTEVELEKGVAATLFEKRGVADQQTRTFRMALIAPNRRRSDRRNGPTATSVEHLLPVLDNPLQVPGGGLYTLEDAVYEDATGTAVFKVRGLSQGERSPATLSQELSAERVNVRLGDESIRIASFALVEVFEAAPGNGSRLSPGDLVVPHPSPEHLQGFRIEDRRWLLRPGDLVRVGLDQGQLPPGHYVPVRAIRERDGTTWVFTVDDEGRARALDVSVHESYHDLRRISAPTLVDGARVVARGAHFLSDGDEVTVTSIASGPEDG